MEEKIKIEEKELRKLGISNPGYKVPDNYFDTFSDQLFSKVAETSIPSKTGFTTPDNYFENLEKQIFASTINKKRKQKIRILYTLSTVAASLLLIFSIFNHTNKENVTFDSITISDVQVWMENGNLSLDSYTIASIATDEDLEELEHFNVSNEEMEDYLESSGSDFLYLEN